VIWIEILTFPHRLSLEQLESLIKYRPKLLDESPEFVETYIAKLNPRHNNIEINPEAKKDYLNSVCFLFVFLLFDPLASPLSVVEICERLASEHEFL